MKRTIVLILLAFLIIAIGFSFIFLKKKAIPVKVIALKRESITSILNATGTVVSRQQAVLSAILSAQAKDVYVYEGDKVAAGTLLALFESQDLEGKVKEAQETVHQAEEKVRRVKRDHESLMAVYSVGGTSRQSVDDARSALEIARSETNKALAELKTDKITIAKLKIRAPFAGIITKRDINPGEWASSGTALFSLAKMTSREIEIMVDGSDDNLVKIGQSVELASDASPGQTWEEHVLEVAPALKKDGSTNSVKVRVSYGLQAPDLKLGQQVDAKVRTAHRDDIVKAPFDCIINRDKKPFVAMVKDNLIRFVPVVTGIEDMVSVEIVKGVSAGEKIVSPEGKPLKEGEQVTILTTNSLKQ